MLYRALAHGVVVFHLAFILVAVGFLLAWRRPTVALAHLPALPGEPGA